MKKRIYEYAKEKNVTSKEVIDRLAKMGIEVNNHMSVITEDTINKLEGKNGGASDKKVSSNPKRTGDNASVKEKSSNNNTSVNKGARKGPQNKGPQNKGPQNKGPQNNKRGRKGGGGPKPQKPKAATPEYVKYELPITVGAFAEKLNKEPSEIIKKLMGLGVMATINQELDKDTVELLGEEFGVEVEEEIIIDESEFENIMEEDNPADLVERSPVVTIMGHVDHGKTTLLDGIRHTKVTAGEAGGITQHIGAYQVEENGKKITFLDTPGHAAFTTMRARGAQVTDITILVVAADDGVMPQTVEAINHAKAAEVPIIVAVNKIDKEGSNPDRVMQELTEHGLVAEAWGGETIFVNVSAIQGEGIDDLLEMILLVSEVEELKANPDKEAFGTVVEAELDRGRGPVATLLVQAGTLNVGDPIVVGNAFGKVRAMVNDLGRRVKSAGPSTPVEITGLNSVPQAGDQFKVFKDEKKARQIGEARAVKHKEATRKESSKVSLDDLFDKIQQGDIKDINIIVKADVQGSAEAMKGSLEKIEVEGVKVNIIHTGVGAIAESDIILAAASNAIVIGFNVRPDVNAKRTAEAEKVEVRLHRVIYDAIEEVEAAMKGMLDPVYEEKVIGQAEVRHLFKVSRIGTIAGSYVTDGKITRDSSVRVIREGVVVFEGKLKDLKRFKDDVKEVAKNYECGITLENFNDVKEGDTIEAYIMEEIKR
ncbi:MAG: translation initiation factor IF-2 [Alkalicoccus sp.]|nr:MAG: translation initiation factor IF-2 [Alkalicoccus sp.]